MLKLWIPIQDIVLKTIDCIQNDILVGMLLFPPIRAKDVLCAVDDVCNPILSCESWSQHFSRSHQDP